MRLTRLLAMITFLMPQVATAQLVRHNSIPEAYWGTWAPADANCQDANKSSIALSDHAYENSTTSCVVKYVTWAERPYVLSSSAMYRSGRSGSDRSDSQSHYSA